MVVAGMKAIAPYSQGAIRAALRQAKAEAKPGLLNPYRFGENAHHFTGTICGHRSAPLVGFGIASVMQIFDDLSDGCR